LVSPIRHGERLFLVVRHEDEGDAGLELQPLELDLHLLAQLEVEGGERLVEQQHLGARRQRPGQRHALLLAPRQLAAAPVGERLHAHQRQHLAHCGRDLSLRPVEHLQAEADVLGHGHVREQGVALEHRVDRALERRQRADVLAVEEDHAAARMLEAGDQA